MFYNLTSQPASQPASQLENCTFVRTALMILIVFYHSCVFWTNEWFMAGKVIIPSQSLSLVSRWLNSFHVYCFTLISGYIFYTLKFVHGRYQKYTTFVANKAKRLLVPYVFVSAIWVVPISVWLTGIEWPEILKSYILGEGPSQLWFLLMLFWVFVVIWPLSDYLNKHSIQGMIIMIGIYLLGRKLSGVVPNIWGFVMALQYEIYFYLGFLIAKRKILINYKNTILWLFVSVVLWLTVKRIYLPNALKELLVHATGAIAWFYMLQLILQKSNFGRYGFLRVLANNSMTIYLFHQQLIYISIVCLNGKINPWMHAQVNFMFSLIMSLLISVFLKKNKYIRFLLGEK